MRQTKTRSSVAHCYTPLPLVSLSSPPSLLSLLLAQLSFFPQVASCQCFRCQAHSLGNGTQLPGGGAVPGRAKHH